VFNQLDWNPAYSIETLEPNTVFFLSERESICFQEPLYYRLVRLIDGQRNLDEIIAFPVDKRYILNPEKLNQQRLKCATQM